MNVSVGSGFPLGAVSKEGGIQFSLVLPKEEVTLVLFPGEEKEKRIPMNSFQRGSIASVFCAPLEGKVPYSYEHAQGTFLDPYVKEIKKAEPFGEPGERTAWAFGEKRDILQENEVHPLLGEGIYRLHVRGYTMGPDAMVEHPGTLLGLEEKIPYWKKLGISYLEFLPVYDFQEREVQGKKTLYWGYSEENHYFAVHPSYVSCEENPLGEFDHLVKRIHGAGMGLLLEFYFPKHTPSALQLDVLRYWALERKVDGFSLKGWPDFYAIGSDPVLADRMIIGDHWEAERLGLYRGEMKTPPHLFDYLSFDQDRERQSFLRGLLKGDEGMIRKMPQWLMESMYPVGKVPHVTDTNGFTLRDLYSYDCKHNEGNGESGKDGPERNDSWNCGSEGETEQPKILRMRKRMMENAFLLNLLLPGAPQILAGDELGQTQQGNNNCYCQDNAMSWIHWENKKENAFLQRLFTKLLAFRKTHPLLNGKVILTGRDTKSTGCPDISFHGQDPWKADLEYGSRVLGVLWNGAYDTDSIHPEHVYAVFNFHWEKHMFRFPSLEQLEDPEEPWKIRFGKGISECNADPQKNRILVPPRTICILTKGVKENKKHS